MHQRQQVRLFFILTLCFSLFVASAQAQQKSPVNVTLSSFVVFPLDDAARIEWSTDTEIDLAGFFLRRAHGSDDFVDLDSVGFIPGTGGDVSGADYMVIDDTAVNGQTYTYKLFELETDSDEIPLAEETVTLTGPSPTPAPIGGGPGANPTNTPPPSASTAIPTATRQATNTPVPTGTRASGITPTATSRATASPTAAPTTVLLPSPTRPSATAIPASPTPQPIVSTPISAPTTAVTKTLPTPTIEVFVINQEVIATATNPPTPIPGNIVLAQEPDPLAQAVPIGSQPSYPIATVISTQMESTADAGSGRLLLWVSFLAAAILFVTSVIGSILLFTRKQDNSLHK